MFWSVQERGSSVCGVSLSFFCWWNLRERNFASACLITLSNKFYKNFFPERSHSPGKRQNWILLFYQSGRTSTHIENILPVWSRGSVAHSFNLLHKVRYRTTERTAPNRWQRFESSCNQSVFIFFPLLGPHVLVLFFDLLISFILRGLLYLISFYFEILPMSLLHYFYWKWRRNNLRIKEFFKQNPNQWEEEEV